MGMIEEVLDSTILIDALNGYLVAIRWISEPKRFAISLVTWIEVMAGAAPEDEADFQQFLAQFTLIEVTPEIAARAARLRATRKLKLPDAIILATAQALRCPLVTRNTKDFAEDTEGIKIPYRL